MGSFITKSTLETYLQTNWTQTTIQFEGVPFPTSGVAKFIALKYVGVANDQYFSGRKYLNAQLQVFCYAKTSTLCHKLADDVCTLMNCKQLGDIEVRVGQIQGSAQNLDKEPII